MTFCKPLGSEGITQHRLVCFCTFRFSVVFVFSRFYFVFVFFDFLLFLDFLLFSVYTCIYKTIGTRRAQWRPFMQTILQGSDTRPTQT